MFLLRLAWVVVRALFAKKANLVAENLALRQQLIGYCQLEPNGTPEWPLSGSQTP